MTQQYHIANATEADEASVREIFKSAETKFHLTDTMLASLIKDTICSYSDELCPVFGLGALRIGDLIQVDLNPCKAPSERYRPVFDYIVFSLRQSFGERFVAINPSEQIDLATLSRLPIAEAHREFVLNLLAARKPSV